MQRPGPSITTPALDAVLTGGLSAVVMAILLAWALAFDGNVSFVQGEWITVLILVNATHFTVSYKILYVSREEILGNPWSTMYVPALLVGSLVVAATTTHRDWIVEHLVLLSSVYLAWHYTGQAWGMVSAFSRILGDRLHRRPSGSRSAPGMRILLFAARALRLLGSIPSGRTGSRPRRYDPSIYGVVFQGIAVFAAGASSRSRAAPPPTSRSATRRGNRRSRSARDRCRGSPSTSGIPFWYFVPGGFPVGPTLPRSPVPGLPACGWKRTRYANRGERADFPHRDRGPPRRSSSARLLVAGALFAPRTAPDGLMLALGDGWWSSRTGRSWSFRDSSAASSRSTTISWTGAIWKLQQPQGPTASCSATSDGSRRRLDCARSERRSR